jgi:hypothetical protein
MSTSGGHAGEVLEDDARRLEGDFDVLGCLRIPRREVRNVLLVDELAVHRTEDRFEHHPDRVGQGLEVRGDARPLESVEAVDREIARLRLEGGAGGERG